jgi:hypothetical protein
MHLLSDCPFHAVCQQKERSRRKEMYEMAARRRRVKADARRAIFCSEMPTMLASSAQRSKDGREDGRTFLVRRRHELVRVREVDFAGWFLPT